MMHARVEPRELRLDFSSASWSHHGLLCKTDIQVIYLIERFPDVWLSGGVEGHEVMINNQSLC